MRLKKIPIKKVLNDKYIELNTEVARPIMLFGNALNKKLFLTLSHLHLLFK